MRAPRSSDETLLSWVALRSGGMTCKAIADLHAGVTEGTVRVSTYSIRQADIQESGEPASRVASAYWQPGKGAGG